MKSRRLMIGMVSMHIVASWGKEIGDKIKDSIPDGTKILMQKDNFNTASLDIILYNDNFPEVAYGYDLQRFNLDVPLKDAKKASSIILPRH